MGLAYYATPAASLLRIEGGPQREPQKMRPQSKDRAVHGVNRWTTGNWATSVMLASAW